MNPRVWHLCSNRWFSAITDYALSAHQALTLMGWDSYFFPLEGSPGHRLALEAAMDSKRIVPLDKGGFRWGKRLWRPKFVPKPTWILAYGGPETITAVALSQRYGCRVGRFFGQDRDHPGLMRSLMLNRLNVAFYPSEYAFNRHGRPKSHLKQSVIELGRDVAFSHGKESWASDPVIRIVGRLDPIKGHDAFIRLFARFRHAWPKSLPPVRLEIIGVPANLNVADLHQSIERWACSIQNDISIITEYLKPERRLQLMGESLLGSVPSLGSEIICRVAEEFALCGTPVFVSGVGSLANLGIPEFGRHYLGLTEEQQIETLRLACHEAIGESATRRFERATIAKERFSLSAMGKALTELLT